MSRIDILLRLVPDAPDKVMASLAERPDEAGTQDEHGYSLAHAAASYGQVDLLRTLVQRYHVPVNIADEDGETPLFYAESLPVVRCLVDELAADIKHVNQDGMSAPEKLEAEAEGDWVGPVVAYLRGDPTAGVLDPYMTTATSQLGQGIVSDRPPLVPEHMQINFGTMVEPAAAEEEGVDLDLRRRIDQLATRPDLQTDDAQAELRTLVTEVVVGMRQDVVLNGGDVQRRRINGLDD